jgi:predicted metal-dependent hydrolase
MKIKETIFFIILLAIVIIFITIHKTEALLIESSIDKEFYVVRNMDDKQKAADLLAEIKKKLIHLIETLYKNDKDAKYARYVKRIKNKIYSVTIRESSANSKYTSYSVNKGEEIVFCLRSKKTHQLHPINRIMYVAIHEIAHIGSPEVGHTTLFNDINKYLLSHGMKLGIYKYENYTANPVEYCGLTLNNNIL